MATSPLLPRGSPPLKSGGAKSEVAHNWARWLHHPCRLGDPHRLRAGGRNHKWPTSGQGGYITPAASGIPTASKQGGKIRSGPQVGKVATSPLLPRGSPPLKSGGAKSQVAQKWAMWLHHPCRLGDPHRFKAGKIAHKWARWLHHPCCLGDPHRLRAGGRNHKWPRSGQCGYITPAASGIPTASKHGGKIRSGPQVGKVATSPLPPRESPPIQSWGGRIRSGPQVGKVATSPLPPRGSPPLRSREAKSEVAHRWARWLHSPCRLGDPHQFRAGG